MVIVNPSTKEMTGKIVFYGPGLCGKTTNLQFIYETLEEDQRGKMLTLATDTDRTIFFDFLPVDLGTVRGFRVRVQIYTVPGQVFYRETRKRVLKGADGVVFVADSQRTMEDANKKSYEEMQVHLSENGLDPAMIPLVIQYNKRDLADILSVEELDEALNPRNAPFFESVATDGIGVEDTLRGIMKLVLGELKKKMTQKPGRISAKFVTSASRADEIAAKVKDGEPVPMEAILGDAVAEASQPLVQEETEEDELLLGGEEDADVLEAEAKDSESPFEEDTPPLDLGSEEQEVLLGGDAEEDLLSVEVGASDDNPFDTGGEDVLAPQEETPLPEPGPEPELEVTEKVLEATHPSEPEEEIEHLDTSTFAEELTGERMEESSLDLKPGEPVRVTLTMGGRRFRLTVRLDDLDE